MLHVILKNIIYNYQIFMIIILITCIISALLSTVRNRRFNCCFSYKNMLYINFFLNYITLPSLLIAYIHYLNYRESYVIFNYSLCSIIKRFYYWKNALDADLFN
ncbi:hypothetical protein C1645_780809 [Glomus cerebriforme]|uniref:Uncharacterized protein n=1 Tax=Glomus cerebriforme TaxID=658196 RepID=A0A397SMW5_9GLOM|nr:hypothetical protein C1645_780809 [Glomus cerebriforme]